MKRIVQQITLLSVLLLFIVACGGGGSTSTQNSTPNLTEFKVEVNIPNSVSSKQTVGIQKETTTFTVSKVTITVKDKDDNPLFDNPQEMVLVNGVWSATLLLDETKAPFSFIADGYDSNGVHRYTGSSTVTSLRQSVVLSVNSVPQEDDTIKVPYLKSITSTLLSGGKQQLNVTVINEGLEDMNYSITAFPEICAVRFEPRFGQLTFKTGVLPLYEQGFTLLVHDANETCAAANYQLNMQTVSGQGFSTPLNLKNGPSGITVNFPPKIDSFNFTQDGATMIFKAEASDAEGGDVRFDWTEVISVGQENKVRPISGTKSNEWIVEQINYPQTKTFEVKVKLTDGEGAVRYYTYHVKNSNPTLNVYKYPLKKTGQVKSYVAHDDGAYQKGVTPSYTRDATKEVVLDNIEGYMWQDDSDVATKTFASVQDAKSYCDNLTLGLYNDWTLPKAHLLYNLINLKTNSVDATFVNKSANNSYFTDSAYDDIVNGKTEYTILETNLDRSSSDISVRCIRPTNPLFLLGMVQRDANGIVKDNRYGLEWQDNVALNTIQGYGEEDAIKTCENLTLGNKTDWRLPNIHELLTLVDYRKDGNITGNNRNLTNKAFQNIDLNGSTILNYLSSTFVDGSNNDIYFLTNEGLVLTMPAPIGIHNSNEPIPADIFRCVRDSK